MNPHHDSTAASTTDGLPVGPSLGPALERLHVPHQADENRARIVYLSLLAAAAALAAALAAELLVGIIVTNLAFYGRVSLAPVSPAGNQLGIGVVGGAGAGRPRGRLMAHYGTAAIRGHGIPEAMERVLRNESRIAPRVTLLKPLSTAVGIGADERKTLLAAGAAAGMAAVFGTP